VLLCAEVCHTANDKICIEMYDKSWKSSQMRLKLINLVKSYGNSRDFTARCIFHGWSPISHNMLSLWNHELGWSLLTGHYQRALYYNHCKFSISVDSGHNKCQLQLAYNFCLYTWHQDNTDYQFKCMLHKLYWKSNLNIMKKLLEENSCINTTD